MIWLDIETRSTADVTRCGVYRMAEDPTLRIISKHFAFDDGPVQHWRGLFARPGVIESVDKPPFELWDRIASGEPVGIWNAGFERGVWNAVAKRTPTMPRLELPNLRCIATLARAHNLPGKLKSASDHWLPLSLRKTANTNYYDLWRHETELTLDHEFTFGEMLRYGDMDVVSMRGMAKLMLDFDEALLRDYQVAETINDRGLGVDAEWCARAVELKAAVDAEVRDTLVQLTRETCEACGGSCTEPGKRPNTVRKCHVCNGEGEHVITSAKQAAALREWVLTRLAQLGAVPEEGLFLRDKKTLLEDGTGYRTKTRDSFDKTIRRNLLEWMDEEAIHAPDIRDLLTAIDEGSGAASTKYAAALDRSSSDGALRGMYILDGASQTGRFASTGMQTHNLKRDVLPNASEAILQLQAVDLAQVPALCRERWQLPVNEVLGRLLRPTLVPRTEGKVMLWGDWSAVEARVCPWLSGLPSAERVLDVFRGGGDIYLEAASDIAGYTVTDKEDPNRQLGKVAVLSLGFGGAVGAYVAMARNYGIEGLPKSEVQDIVYAWRDGNPWAQEWWSQLEAAAFAAMRYPGEEFPAGRVSFIFMKGFLDGCLIMTLPDGRPLFYPAAEVRMGRRSEDEPLQEVLTFQHAVYGRMPLWYGQLAENATQATAASLLRRTLSRLEEVSWSGETVGHTHDEVIGEAHEALISNAAYQLRKVMVEVPEWAPGLPLEAEVKAGYAYYEADRDLLR